MSAPAAAGSSALLATSVSPATPVSRVPGDTGAPPVTARTSPAARAAVVNGRSTGSSTPAATRLAAAPAAEKWKLVGSATADGGELRLSAAGSLWSAGAAFWPGTFVGATNLAVSFDASMSGGNGADGMTLAVVDATAPVNAKTGRVTSAGSNGGGLGWAGLPGFAVALDTFQNLDDPGYNTVGLVTGFAVGRPNHLTWAAADTSLPSLRRGVQKIQVAVAAGVLTVTVNGTRAFQDEVTLPAKMWVGFTAGNGRRTDNHLVSDVHIAAY